MHVKKNNYTDHMNGQTSVKHEEALATDGLPPPNAVTSCEMRINPAIS